jgi:Spy/CpxP family protein refolding chaperone
MDSWMTSLERRMTIAAIALCGVGLTLGCRAGSADVPPPVTAVSTTAATDDVAAGLMEHHRYHHHDGLTLFIEMSLDMLGVSPEQRVAVDKVRADLHARLAPARNAEQNLMTLLADGLGTANIDVARVDAAIVAVAASAAAAHDATVDGLNDLHTVLTAPQRDALVDKVEAHWAVWQRANAEETGPANAGPPVPM